MSKLINEKELLKYVHSMTDLIDDLSIKEKIFVTKEYLKAIEIFDKLNQGKALRETLEKFNEIDEKELEK